MSVRLVAGPRPVRPKSASRAPLASLSGLALFALALLAGCGGGEFTPRDETTGRPAAPLGRVMDFDLTLPGVTVAAGVPPGIELGLTLAIEGPGPGETAATTSWGEARSARGAEQVEDLSGGRTKVREAGESFTTTRIGPIRVGEAVFELYLEGTTSARGYRFAGEAYESQSALGGPAQGWRRQRFLVASSDFGFGGQVDLVSWVRDRAFLVERRVAPASSDPVLRQTGRSAFVVNRLSFDNLARLDPEEGFALSWQAGVGTGANPHDALLLEEDALGGGRDPKLYVTRFEPPFDDLVILDPRGGATRGTIELSSLATNRDATPRPDRMRLAAGRVFVGLQNIDRSFTRYGEARLAVVDPLTDLLVDVVDLPAKNPGALELVPAEDPDAAPPGERDPIAARLYVAAAGIYEGLLPRELSGGVFVVDPSLPAFERVALDDDDAGGNVGALAMADHELGYVVVADESFTNRVRAFDVQRGLVLRELESSTNLVPELELSAGRLLAVPRRDFAAPALCLYRVPESPAGSETFLGCAALPLPPASLEALD